MNTSQCKHVRIRDTNEYGIDVEVFIKSIEKQYNINFKSLPQWKELIKVLHAATTECKKQITASKYRKTFIVNKIYTENTRPSPFELTENLSRTAKIWKAIELKNKQPKVSIKATPEDVFTQEYYEEDKVSEEITEFTAHPNTEIVLSEDDLELNLKSEIDTQENIIEPSHLPTNICTNQHKRISSVGSQYCYLSYKSVLNDIQVLSEAEQKEWLFLKQTLHVKCLPKKIKITNHTLNEQSVSVSLVNCTTEYLHLRFKCVTDKSPFKKFQIVPATSQKLYPGISVTFKVIFKLSRIEEFPTSYIYFRVGQNFTSEKGINSLLIPIIFKKTYISISVPETVSIDPVYSWHVNARLGFPTESVKVSNNDNSLYHLHIIKRLHNFVRDPAGSLMSVDVIGPNTESIINRVDDADVETNSDVFSPSKGDAIEITEVESLKTIDVIALVVEEIVDLALEAFVFEHTCLDLHPHAKKKIPVYFTKAEHMGFHQCYYDFQICDPDTEAIILTKTIKLYAEVLPHPVQIKPDFLDMSGSPVTHGFCEDAFIVTNAHKVYPVTVKIKLTTKMNKLLKITPTDVMIPSQSSVNFVVRICSRSFARDDRTDDFVHFTFKIIFSGHESVYNNIPPHFYEIIAPCAFDFKKIYNTHFFRELPEKSEQDISKNLVKSFIRFSK